MHARDVAATRAIFRHLGQSFATASDMQRTTAATVMEVEPATTTATARRKRRIDGHL